MLCGSFRAAGLCADDSEVPWVGAGGAGFQTAELLAGLGQIQAGLTAPALLTIFIQMGNKSETDGFPQETARPLLVTPPRAQLLSCSGWPVVSTYSILCLQDGRGIGSSFHIHRQDRQVRGSQSCQLLKNVKHGGCGEKQKEVALQIGC